jgi:hypothetical protein
MENPQNTVEVSGKQLLSKLASDVKELCTSVDVWLARQNEIIERVSNLEQEIQSIKSRL